MIFKNNLKLSFMAIAVAGWMGYAPMNAQAQDSFYYADGKQINLTEDRSTAMVKLNENGIQAVSAMAALEVHPNQGRAIIEMGQQTSLQSLSGTNGIQSFNYGYRLDDGFQVWTTEEVLLELNKGIEVASLQPLMEEYGATYKRTDYNTVVLTVEDMKNALPLSNQLTTSGLVAWSHPNFYHKVEHLNDPLFNQQFQMHNTGQTIQGFRGVNDADANALEAWGITRGASNIRVSVVDDGVEPHEDIDGPVAGFTPADNGNGRPFRSTDGHGQACAGIIVANHNNIGVRGVAPNSTLLAVNIFRGGETALDLANAINWSVQNGADVISNSWGYNSCTFNVPALTNAIRNARNNGRGGRGTVVVFASGNSYGTCVSYPANLPEVIAVGAFNNRGIKSEYSNGGPALDIVAPSNDISRFGQRIGAGVMTIDRMGGNGYTSGNYTPSFGGTSAACPVVAGVAALVLAVNPGLSVSAVENILYSTAIDMGPNGRDNLYGNGRVNAFGAVQRARQVQLVSTPNRLGTEDSAFENALATYPNPVVSQLTVDFAYNADNTYSAQLVNFMGQVVSDQAVSATANTIDMSGLAPGTYILRLVAEGKGTQAITKVLRVE